MITIITKIFYSYKTITTIARSENERASPWMIFCYCIIKYYYLLQHGDDGLKYVTVYFYVRVLDSKSDTIII